MNNFNKTQIILTNKQRPLPKEKIKVLAITGGKGGVGKSSVCVNLGLALTYLNKKVILLDADLSLANINIMLNLKPKKNLFHVLNENVPLNEIVMEGPNSMAIIPASNGIRKMAELSELENFGLISAFSELTHNHDYMLVDTAAGINNQVTSFAAAADEVFVVITSDPTSIADAYALIKLLKTDYGIENFNIICNMVKNNNEGATIFQKLLNVTSQFLTVKLNLLGTLPNDPSIRDALQNHKAVVELYPSSKISRSFMSLASRITELQFSGDMHGRGQFLL